MKKLLATSLMSFVLFAGGLVFGNATEASTSAAGASDIAKKYLGVNYKWGGISPTGFDCSGLVGYSFKQAGQSLPRTAAEMFQNGQAVSKSSLQKGDLVFFSTYKKGASHVGIYLGSSQFIHAGASGVKIDNLYNPYWNKAYYGSKRM